MPRLAFSTDPFIEQLGSLNVFLPRRDAVLMHLAHPTGIRTMMRRFARWLSVKQIGAAPLSRRPP